ncbi:hypothetical protein PHYPO_G00155010 [Pangasianodon hypophthalmus]|uniref:Uncharacterized protein n=1 Tax=Pangasianodon hypophthalmus TaxID=310915 RepID=A0A5N5K1P5_PANHP|nr:hypothetical protein PHYPO_G00155010 [Pangasianodon hypophthalmus]
MLKKLRLEAVNMSRLRSFWHSNKVLIVMGSGLGFIHWGWYSIKSNPLLRQNRDDYTPEPGIVSYTECTSAQSPVVSALSVYGEDEEPELAEEELVLGCRRSFPQPPFSHVGHAEGDEEIRPSPNSSSNTKDRVDM